MSEKPTVIRRVLENQADYTVTHMWAAAGPGAPPHSHPHKQFIYILRGRGVFNRGGEPITVSAGDYLPIAGGVPHTFDEIIEEMDWLEFFTPGREDF